MGLWLSFVGGTIGEMLEVREALLIGAVRLAAQRRGPAAVDELRTALDALDGTDLGPADLAAFEAKIAAAASNAALALFIEVVGELGVSRIESGWARFEPEVGTDELRAHAREYRGLLAAIEAGDDGGAADEMHRLLDAVRPRLHDAKPRRRPRVREARSDGRLAERVAAALQDDIERARWPVGQVLGSETDLIERYGVSRAILREAVRILEHHGAVRTKRGPNGGLIVAIPDSDAILRSARMILEYDGVTVEQLLEARAVLEVAAVRSAATRDDPAADRALAEAIQLEARRGDAADQFLVVHHAVAAATGNRLFGLFIDVMGGLVPSRIRSDHRTSEGLAELSVTVHRAHEKIVAAIVDRDPDLAERRMLRHLRASADVLE
jgi:DNA-binding FadR family transcriptional regulator